MKLKNIFLSTLVLLASSAAFALTDGDIAEMMKHANDAEIDAGKLAKSRATTPAVKDFAKDMIAAHEDNMKEGKKVAKNDDIKARASDESKEFKKTAKDQYSELKKKKGTDFDRAYIAHQIAMHQQLLNELDQKFIPQAQSQQFKAFLTETKGHVQEHLAKAQQVQQSLPQ